MNNTFTFWIPDRVVPKARPRFSNGVTYTQANYASWKTNAIASLKNQLPPRFKPINYPCCIQITAVGFLRGDADNVAGSVLDALVQASVIKDDRASLVPSLGLNFERDRALIGVLIEITEACVEQFDRVKYQHLANKCLPSKNGKLQKRICS